MGFKRADILAPVIFALVALALAAGCDNDPVRPHSASLNHSPASWATDVPVLTSLQWSCPEFNPATDHFTLYFGWHYPPPRYDSLLTDTIYHIGPLTTGTTYYWQLALRSDTLVVLRSPVWRFTTASEFTFPLTLGNTWSYVYRMTAVNLVPDTVPIPFGLDQIYYSTTEITDLITWADIETYVFRTDVTGDIETLNGYEFRYATADGLFTLGYSGSAEDGPPKREAASNTYLVAGGRTFGSFSEMAAAFRSEFGLVTSAADTIFEPYPIQDLAYPIEIGQRWAYRSTRLGDQWNMEKGVVGEELVTVPAGQFKCLKIEWLWDVNADGDWDSNIRGYDHIWGGGYVRREFQVDDVQIVDFAGDTLGSIDIVEVWELTDYDLHQSPGSP